MVTVLEVVISGAIKLLKKSATDITKGIHKDVANWVRVVLNT